MKRLMFATAALLLLGVVAVHADQKSRGKSHKAAKAESTRYDDRDGRRVAASIRFTTGEVRVIREYYAPRYRSLPPGLQKKVRRGGQLPPGWRKKMQPFPMELERQLGPLPRDCGRGVIDGHAVIYDSRTRAIIDVTVLF